MPRSISRKRLSGAGRFQPEGFELVQELSNYNNSYADLRELI